MSLSPTFHELCGAIHLHTTFSDGSTPFPELVSVAQSVGLDYIVVTDHLTLKGREEGFEGTAGKLLVVVGYEHEDLRGRNHYLVMGTESVINTRDKPQNYIDEVKQQNGIGFLAHPMERRNYFKRLPPYPWTDWTVTGFDGIEIWNQTSDWVENLRSLFHFIRIFFPRRFISDPPAALIKKWDDLNRTRFVSGIGGVDAHAHVVKIGVLKFTIFPLKVELKAIRTHLLLPEDVRQRADHEARAAVLNALRRGHGFVSNYRRGDAKGTVIALEQENGPLAPGLHDTTPVLPAYLIVNLPVRAEIRLVRNGTCISMLHSESARFPITKPGSYRIEVRRKGRAWIYSNPFPVGDYPL